MGGFFNSYRCVTLSSFTGGSMKESGMASQPISIEGIAGLEVA
jgi:hypothetical protein